MRNVVLISCVVHFISDSAVAQFNETIRTGRPGQAIGSFTTGEGILQVQTGMNYFNSNNSKLDYKSQGIANNTVVRYGLTEPFEISGQFNYTHESITELGQTGSKHGIDALDIGMRYHIYTAQGAMPNIGFQFRLRLPVLSKGYEIRNVAPIALLVISQRLSKKFFLITNWGTSWNGNDNSPSGNYVINLSFPFNEKLGGFIENYGSLSHGIFSSKFDTGLAWQITNDLQLDLYGGYGSNLGFKEYFVSTGISLRTNKTKN